MEPTLLDDLSALHASGRRWYVRRAAVWAGDTLVDGWRASMFTSLTVRLDTAVHARYEDAVSELALTWGLMALVEREARAVLLVGEALS